MYMYVIRPTIRHIRCLQTLLSAICTRLLDAVGMMFLL